MLVAIIFTVILGMFLGYTIVPSTMINHLDLLSSVSLAILLFGVGIDIGKNKEVLKDLKKIGFKIILIPILIAIGSIIGAALGGRLLNLPINESTAIGAGFGWYSLSAVILSKIYSADLGALAFLTNVFREIIAIILIPIMAKVGMKVSVIAPGGATTMDTTLPLITRSVKESDIIIMAFVSGAILSSLVPLLVPLLIKI